MAIKSSTQISLTDITDAYSITLTSEAYTFTGESTGAQPGLSCTTQVVAYCGSSPCTNVNIGAIQCPIGISATVTDNGTVSPTITFTTTEVITDSCEAVIPISVNDVTINKKFSFSVAMSADSAALDDLTERVSQTEVDLDNKVTKGTVSSEISQEDGIITISGDRLIVDTTNLNISQDGAVECSSMDITGGRISLSSDSTVPLIDVTYITPTHNNKTYLSGTSLYTNVNGVRITDFDLSAGILHISDPTGSVCTSITREVVDAPNIVAAHNITGATISAHSSMNIYKPGSFSEDAIRIWADTEGGNISIWSPNGVQYQMDAFDDNFRIFCIKNGGLSAYLQLLNDGTLLSPGRIISQHPDGLRIIYNNIGFFTRFDGVNTYFMFTNANDPFGGYSAARPLILSQDGSGQIGSVIHSRGSITSVVNVNASGQVTANTLYAHTIIRSSLISRTDTADNGYVNFVNTSNSAYAPIRAGGFTNMSSEKTKEHISDMTIDEARKLLDIDVISFDYKENFGGKKDNFGVLAEQVISHIPYVVDKPEEYDENSFDESKGIDQPLMGVDYIKFVPYLIKMIQIQQKEIEDLKSVMEVK